MVNTAEPTGVLKVIQMKTMQRMHDDLIEWDKKEVKEKNLIDIYAVTERAQRLAEKEKLNHEKS